MADNLDKLLQSYFSGNLDKKIKARTIQLQFRNDVDENVGGGRAQYKFNNHVESQMIALEQDSELRELTHNKKVIEMWLNGVEEEARDVLTMHYGLRYTWYKIALELNKSVTALQRWKREFKSSISQYVDI
ncbi:DUF722 domain-containing protein [Weissella confusa]|uniref:DUF722 domain-containing protein n=1 Tax=Weissella confusa TaxID=1583 RepID=UPI0018A31715|nr:DUF722 domain-containing protein [Weissella confusa]MBF7056562.1 DUF722 domain-containing protein [Weissella confusa]